MIFISFDDDLFSLYNDTIHTSWYNIHPTGNNNPLKDENRSFNKLHKLINKIVK